MPKLVNKQPGRRVNIWLSADVLAIWDQLDNGSKFVQLALQDAVGIMTWAILRKQEPEKYQVDEQPFEEVVGDFNRQFPPPTLSAKHQGKQKWPENSQKLPDILS